MTKLKAENNILDTNYLCELDNKVKLLPITFDPIYKGIFGSNIELLKNFFYVDFIKYVCYNSKDIFACSFINSDKIFISLVLCCFYNRCIFIII